MNSYELATNSQKCKIVTNWQLSSTYKLPNQFGVWRIQETEVQKFSSCHMLSDLQSALPKLKHWEARHRLNSHYTKIETLKMVSF